MIPLVAAGALLLGAACDDGGEDADASPTVDVTSTAEASPTVAETATEAATEAATPTETPTVAAATGTADGTAEAEAVAVTADDYEFEGLPEEVAAGTLFTLTNMSEGELHEFVAFRLEDDDERTVEEILELPEEELMAELGAAEPATVIIAMPGEEGIPVVGDGTISEPGRYLVFCNIPVGADPQAYMEAAQAATAGPPQVEGGPPHFTEGMYAELTVS